MNHIINNFEIVVARYNENINWLNKYKDITIVYNKGNDNSQLNDYNVINLPNYGRESHTYLYHIINNYDNLKEYTVFIQGSLDFSSEIKHNKLNIEDYLQMNNFYAQTSKFNFDQLKYPIQHFGKWKNELNSGIMKKSNLTCYSWLKNILDFDDNFIQNIDVAWSAIFTAKKSLIHKKPKVFYEDLLRYIDYHPNPEEGHFFERSWHFILHNNHLKKKIIKVFKFNKFINIDKINIKKDIHHYWINLHHYNKYKNILNDIIIFPNFYFKINKYFFNFKYNDVFYIKIIFDDNNILFIILSPNLEFNLIIFNNSIINKIKNDNNISFHNFNLIIELYQMKIFINDELYFEKNVKEYNQDFINNIPIYIKTNNYNNNIIFDHNINTQNLKFIMLQNSYFEIKKFYQENFLNYFIDYENY